MKKRNENPVLNGDKFGILTVKDASGGGIVLCLCECGKKVSVFRYYLNSGHQKSCGCLKKSFFSKRHGLSKTKFHRAYEHAKERCTNKNSKAYKYYGGRGIRFEWESFEQFKFDMYEEFQEHTKVYGGRKTTLDRIDVNGNYCKKNCRWATPTQQFWNKRNTGEGLKESIIDRFLDKMEEERQQLSW